MNAPTTTDVAILILAESVRVFRKQKQLGDRAITQLDKDELFVPIDPEANSVAVLIKHLHGNMRSRWTDFLTSDGEKPDRGRDGEFIIAPSERSRNVVLQWWEDGWSYVFTAVTSLTPADLQANVLIRGETMPAIAAILRQLDHYAQHVGQIVLLAKHLKGADWQTLSIPRGKSEEVNAEFRRRAAVKSG